MADQEKTDKEERTDRIFLLVVTVLAVAFDCYFLWWLFGILVRAQLSGGNYQ